MKLEVIKLRKEFRDCVAVDDLSFSVETGEVTGFIGPNGSGKTTTMRLIANIDSCTDGDIKLDDVSILEFPELIREHIGYVPDFLPSNDDMTVHDYLDFFANIYGYKTPERQQIVKEIENFVNLKEVKGKIVCTLSKGMKQRLSIARVLISDPDFILMDEPAAELDPRERIELRKLIKVLRENGKGILISSHILSELSEICTSAVIIEKGKLLKTGKLENVINESSKGHNRIFQIKTIVPPDEEIINKISEFPMVSNIAVVGNNIEFEYSGSEEQAGELVNKLLAEGVKFTSFGFKQENLESVFMNITKGIVQ